MLSSRLFQLEADDTQVCRRRVRVVRCSGTVTWIDNEPISRRGSGPGIARRRWRHWRCQVQVSAYRPGAILDCESAVRVDGEIIVVEGIEFRIRERKGVQILRPRKNVVRSLGGQSL